MLLFVIIYTSRSEPEYGGGGGGGGGGEHESMRHAIEVDRKACVCVCGGGGLQETTGKWGTSKLTSKKKRSFNFYSIHL